MSTLRQVMRFGLVGVAGLVVDLAVLYALAPWLGWYAARVLSFLAAATATWWLNRHFTFGGPEKLAGPTWREWRRYIASMLGGAAVNYAVYALVLSALAPPWGAATGVALGSLAGMVLNYLSARHLVFRNRNDASK